MSPGCSHATRVARSLRCLLPFCLVLTFVFALLLPSVAHPGHLSLDWTAPATNTDGSQLTDLASYRIYYGPASRACAARARVDLRPGEVDLALAEVDERHARWVPGGPRQQRVHVGRARGGLRRSAPSHGSACSGAHASSLRATSRARSARLLACVASSSPIRTR